VLFLCVRNSARSQMAEGLLRSMARDRFEAYSAWLEAGAVRPEAEACPYFPGAREIRHWSFPDPAAVQGAGRMAAFRDVRDGLRERIGELAAEG